MTKQVLKIAKWSTTFESSDSRRYKRLPWISLPIGFDSNGYQSMLDRFGDGAPAIYGAWCALLKLAATCNIRGVLATGKGVPFTTARIARLTYFPESVFVDLVDWASSQDVGWIELVNAEEIEWDRAEIDTADTEAAWEIDTHSSPTDDPQLTHRSTRLRNVTERNVTRRNDDVTTDREGPPVSWSSVEISGIVEEANRLGAACRHSKLPYDQGIIWRAAAVCLVLDEKGTLDSMADRLRTRGQVQNANKWIPGVMRKMCEEAGVEWKRLSKEAPPIPQPTTSVTDATSCTTR